MRFNIVSNLTNGVGLQQDYLLLKRELEARGHTVHGVQFNLRPLLAPAADVNIFLEVVNPLVFQAAPQQWAVPNPEWWFHTWDAFKWNKVLAKTRDCERIFKAKVGNRCEYIGWLARDLLDAHVPRERKFLHIAGKSQFKNTQVVVAGCQHARATLTVVGVHTQHPRRVTDHELITLMNSHFCQVMPSAYEGYGQVLHEAMGVGQVIITTNAPPMNEVLSAVLVPSIGTTPHHAGLLHRVSALDVSKAVRRVLAMTEPELQQCSRENRLQFQREGRAFQLALDKLVGTA